MGWLTLVALIMFIFTAPFLSSVFAQSAPTVELNKPSYTWTERVFIKAVSFDHAGDDSIFVSVSTRGHSLTNYKLVENATHPGTFEGEVTLTGFEHDAYGDKTIATQPRTSGTGPRDGFLATGRDDTITVVFDYEESVAYDSATIAWTAGKIKWDGNNCPVDTACTVTVDDPDMNIHPDRPDHLYQVILSSDTDPVGIDVVMVETGDDTGIFSWHYSTTITGNSVGQKLLVSPGDNINIKYVDRTPPEPFATNQPLDVGGSIVFDFAQDGNWPLGDVRRNLEGDGMVINLENLDDYFSTIKKLKDLLDTLDIEYAIENNPTYENKKLILTKRLAFETKEPEDFEKVFKKDPKSFPEEFNGEPVDEDYVMRLILSTLESCPQNPPIPQYCNSEPEFLRDQILNKTGTHTVTESIILEQITMDPTEARLDSTTVSSILETAHIAKENNIEQTSLYPKIRSVSLDSLIPKATAQSSYSIVHISIPQGTSVPGCESDNECFLPASLSVKVGDRVVWSNDDTAAHTVTSGSPANGIDGIFDSSILMSGKTFEHTFDEAGNYDYFCMVHPWMAATINVSQQDLSLPQSDFSSDNPSFSEEIRFLNGFTLGYGFGKTWSYEYNAGFPVIYVEAHVEAGLGIGLRVPVDIKVKIDKAASQPSPSNTLYSASLTVNTRDLDENEYAEMLPAEKVFEGKEFNTYLGPAGSIEVRFFGVPVFEKEKGIPKPESTDFIPPLENKQVPLTEFDVDLCDVSVLCLPSYIGEITLSAGVKGGISGDRITIDSVPINTQENDHEITFTSNGQKTDSEYHVTAQKSLYVHLQDLKYHSNLHFVPRITVELSSPYIPFSFISESMEFPEIEYPDIVLEAHEGTNRKYVVPEFDTIAVIILAVAVASIIAFTARSKPNLKPETMKS